MQGVSEQDMVQIIAPAIKPLVSDRASAVKEACFASVASWLGASRSVLPLKWHVDFACSIHQTDHQTHSALQADELTNTKDALVSSSVQVIGSLPATPACPKSTYDYWLLSGMHE